ncbi:PPOX class F420-dependent oxidoreductase [Amycolatopsis ultiminotia]|uniref:PPOX class F420-dependent oxidoreductase n=1 Tax=Amycolatopsis ultiminotia TaxID=543629 RepID=A0ABP6Y9X2_9PSEU
MPSEWERLTAEKYVLLTTFRRDGRAVPTPVWAAADGDELVVWSAREAGKVKRIRNSGEVRLQACDIRGRTHGTEIRGEARLLDAAGTERANKLIARKYGLVAHVTMFFSRLRGGRERSIGIGLTPA